MCTGISCLKTSSYCLRIASASSNRSSKTITLADNSERATGPNLYDLYETGIALQLSPVMRTMRPRRDDKSTLLANAASVYAVILNDLLSSQGIRLDALWSFTYSFALFKLLQCMLISFLIYFLSHMCNLRDLEAYVGSSICKPCEFYSYGGKTTKLSVGWNLVNLGLIDVFNNVVQAVRFVNMYSCNCKRFFLVFSGFEQFKRSI